MQGEGGDPYSSSGVADKTSICGGATLGGQVLKGFFFPNNPFLETSEFCAGLGFRPEDCVHKPVGRLLM